ncbi:hypothetical protein BDV29DRAFT_162749 [Aspergillus leporis]|uniref:TauD/TfdA-like domain-containing protein n=1 Tax=Aspergillus leporis TaxID=41062 RepID=A0A5N5WL57_9EURO|nr:hypothetical protein BDV29DRAFT_162749 [Aspergillus leporis]
MFKNRSKWPSRTHQFSCLARARQIGTIPHLHAKTLGDSQNPLHVAIVHKELKESGVLKISLGFYDDKSEYLRQLVVHLSSKHGHGLPITHSASRGWFWDVRPQLLQIKKDVAKQARSETMDEFPWHTDCAYEHSPPRYFALHILQPDNCGGGTLSILSSDRVRALLSPAARFALTQPEYCIKVPPEFLKKEDEKHIIGSVLSAESNQTHTQIRLRLDITSGLSTKSRAALEELQGILSGTKVQECTIHLTPVSLHRGTIILLDNRRWLHSRNTVKDPNRHLRRVRWDSQPFGTIESQQLD